ncbi:P-loop containing nucleoside triphosphate hydrolase protein [Lasiosphaeria miniovina]|uniref:P-loop containing nucleoside triphosphate hydrolase protein n=1 Tax=Lasiosphaeria miniovina TaxID=1954250 RepID=A0AA40ALW7_9PEZI|nr:P-loop containing nucleoside triphosphate hydrolase protein [Lasiosphaeria miniovina]KAK0718268.1 P-loop containing nucleoside triphosphate hydrolase protein [Lasiosphaeria miniovina]
MSSLEAKIVVLGSQGVGKTSLVMRYCKGAFNPSQITSTVGASFMTKRVVDSDTDTVVRLQIWDTAGQERFRSISRLYYRGANACILCYSITDAQSFAEMGMWLTELRRNLPADIVLHVVGTKADMVARDPSKREVPFERCIAYVAENLAPGMGSTPPPTATPLYVAGTNSGSGGGGGGEPRSPSSKRSSGFWGQEAGWDACHEISAESGEGVEEVFRVVTRKLVEQNRKMQQALLLAAGTPGAGGETPWSYYGSSGMPASGFLSASAGPDGAGGPGGGGGGPAAGYFDAANARGSFRVGRDRRSWLLFSPALTSTDEGAAAAAAAAADGRNQEGLDGRGLVRGRRKCC